MELFEGSIQFWTISIIIEHMNSHNKRLKIKTNNTETWNFFLNGIFVVKQQINYVKKTLCFSIICFHFEDVYCAHQFLWKKAN